MSRTDRVERTGILQVNTKFDENAIVHVLSPTVKYCVNDSTNYDSANNCVYFCHSELVGVVYLGLMVLIGQSMRVIINFHNSAVVDRSPKMADGVWKRVYP